MEKHHPDFALVVVDSVAEGLERLSEGAIDAFVDNLGVITHEQQRLNLEDIKIAAPTPYKSELAIGVRKDWP